MNDEATLLHHLVFRAEKLSPQRAALTHDDSRLSYARLAEQVRRFADGLISLGLQRGERVDISSIWVGDSRWCPLRSGHRPRVGR
jgi:non-ribosomal peptide synthetase component E (peptide arylation enzyme)